MKRLTQGFVILASAGFLTACSSNKTKNHEETTVIDTVAVQTPASARPTHWGYDGDAGPTAWGTLDPVYALCGTGTNQSPIDIKDVDVKGTHSITVNYGKSAASVTFNEHADNIVDNGHTIQVNVDSGSTLTFNSKVYSLKQFHFHTPTEHTINGKHFPIEVHFVHKADDGSLAVISAMVKEGKENPHFAHLIPYLPQTKGETKIIADKIIDLGIHVPKNSSGYYYMGSLTTPPCSENVLWIVLKDHPEMSKQQIEAFSTILGANNRPTQALNGRVINSTKLSE